MRDLLTGDGGIACWFFGITGTEEKECSLKLTSCSLACWSYCHPSAVSQKVVPKGSPQAPTGDPEVFAPKRICGPVRCSEKSGDPGSSVSKTSRFRQIISTAQFTVSGYLYLHPLRAHGRYRSGKGGRFFREADSVSKSSEGSGKDGRFFREAGSVSKSSEVGFSTGGLTV